MEAMFRGRPVIATDVAGHAELVENGITGFLAEAPKTSSFSKALEEAWARKEGWLEMGINAEKKINSLYSKTPVNDFINIILE